MTRRVLLACGILSTPLYAAMDIIGGLRFEGYSFAAHTVSEQSAIGATTRPMWLAVGFLYQALITLFAIGVFTSAGRNRALRVAGGFLIAYGLIGFTAPLFSMQPREIIATSGPVLTDRLHIVATAIAVILMFSAIWLAAKAFGKGFRLYSIATILLSFAFGAITGQAAPRMEAGLPTPWIGVTERISIAVFMVWVVVFAILLLRRPAIEVMRTSRAGVAA